MAPSTRPGSFTAGASAFVVRSSPSAIRGCSNRRGRAGARLPQPGDARRRPWDLFDSADRPRPLADVLRGRADQLRLALLLEDVRRPARHARAREHRREQLRRHFGEVEDHAPTRTRRWSPARGRAGARAARRALPSRAPPRPRSAASRVRGGAAQDPRARVFGAVDAVAEAHQALAAVERVGDPLLGVARRFDFLEHLQHARRRAAVQRARQRADGARERRREVRAGRRDRRAP